MDVLPEILEFEWDLGNKNKCFLKHGVTVQEAEEVFVNEPLLVVEDSYHSESESRYQALGKTGNGRLLFVSFTLRKEKIRIISARVMSRKETRIYEKT